MKSLLNFQNLAAKIGFSCSLFIEILNVGLLSTSTLGCSPVPTRCVLVDEQSVRWCESLLMDKLRQEKDATARASSS